MKTARLFLSVLLLPLLAFAQDSDLVNYRCGIDVIWGVGDGSDKGQAYMEEYYFHDKLSFSQKQVYLKADTAITMSHNARNVGVTASSGRNRQVLGVNGPDGVLGTGDEGQIRYVVDEIWRVKRWSNSFSATQTKYPAYTAPITLGGLTFDTGHAVVGTTGAHPTVAVTDKANYYWRGMVESNGDEWHVLRYADDDQVTGNNYDDAWASDGNHVLLCVNPKTPGLTVEVTGNGQFYTTPLWTYWTHKLHAQTTYIQPGTGSVTFELRDIYDRNIEYQINGGGWVPVGADNVTLDDSDFNSGSNTLEYRSVGLEANAKTRTVVKNPTHPGIDEGHGNLLWGDAAFTEAQSRRLRAPYSNLFTAMQNRGNSLNQNGQTIWDSTIKGAGLRQSPHTIMPHKPGQPSTNAIAAKFLGWTATASGAPRSYAAYAKEMLLESPLSTSYTGIEATNWASMPVPACDNVYRGYWDATILYNVAVAYDVLMGGFRSDQVSGGISPIEDYYIRDRLAEWVHHAQIPYTGSLGGMWPMCRNVAALVAAVVMPEYSTSYYGTSGIDGVTTTTYEWTPFTTTNYTWKTTFLLHSYTPGSYPVTQWSPFQFTEGMPDNGQGEHLIGPSTLTPVESQVRVWRDRLPYVSFYQTGDDIALYANLWDMYASAEDRSDLENFLDEISAGVLYGAKWNGAYPSAEMTQPYRSPFIWCMNDRFPTVGTNARAWMLSLASNDNNSDDKSVTDSGPLTLFFYDDTVSTPDTTPPTASSFTVLADGDTGTLTLNESVVFGAGGNGGMAMSMSGGAVTATLGTPSGSSIPLTFSRTIQQPETGTWTYTQPGNGIEDLSGNDLATATSQTVTNLSTQNTADNDPPSPNPPTITAVSDFYYGITITSGLCTDAGSSVFYAFSIDNGLTWSTAQSSRVYVVSDLIGEDVYNCLVRAQDSSAGPNFTDPSEAIAVEVSVPPPDLPANIIAPNRARVMTGF